MASVVTAIQLTGERVAFPSRSTAGKVKTLSHARSFLCPVLIGRDGELRQFATWLDRAAAGSGLTVLVGGEAGVGKTAFARHGQELARERGFSVLVGQTDEIGAALPYAPFAAAIRSRYRGTNREELAAELASLAPELTRLFPELDPQAVEPTSALERTRVSVALRDAIARFAGEGPLLIALEDLHWADEASLALLRYLSRELRDQRVLLVATYRSDELHRRHPLTKALATLQRERIVARVDLRRLDRSETGELIRSTLGSATDVPDGFVAAVFQRCEGNPFFAEELLRALADDGAIVERGTGWDLGSAEAPPRIPDSIVEAVRARVERLPDKTRRTLEAAAVVGAEFPSDLIGVLSRVTERHELETLTPREREVAGYLADGLSNKQIAEHLTLSVRTAESHVEHLRSKLGLQSRALVAAWFAERRAGPIDPSFEDHLRELAEMQLLRLPTGHAATFTFRHALTREVIYQDLLPSERKRLHRAVAEALARRQAAEPAIVAHHFVAAGANAEAVPHLLRAAVRARDAGAPREAATHYKHALDLGVSERDVAPTLEDLAEAYVHFDVVLAAKAADEARVSYEAQGDRLGVSRSHQIASRAWRRYPDAIRATDHARMAVETVVGQGSLELGRALAILAEVRVSNGAWREAADLADQAIAYGERFRDPWTLANALVAKSRAIRFASIRDALVLGNRGRELAMRSGLTESTLPGFTHVALLKGFLREPLDTRLAFIEEGLEYARRNGIEETAHLEYMKASILASTGDWDAALATIAPVRESHQQYALGLEATIVRGRAGPEAALPRALEVAERGLRGQFAWDMCWAIPQAATASALAGDTEPARQWLAHLRQWIEEDVDARTQALELGGAAFIAATLVAALLCDEPAWVGEIASGSSWRTDPAMTLHRAEIGAIDSIFRGRPSEAPVHLDVLFGVGGEHWQAVGSGGPWFTVICVREAARRGLHLDSGWRPVIAAAREFSERAGANWYLDQLARYGGVE